MSKIDVEEVWALAHAMADAARVETLALFRGQALGTENKVSDGYDPVTLADRASERAMRSLIEARRPDDGILGEEEGVKVAAVAEVHTHTQGPAGAAAIQGLLKIAINWP